MNFLRTDQYTRVSLHCPVSIELHPVDDIVEIVIGEYRFGGDTLRLLVDNPDTCGRLTEALDNARDKLSGHLHAKANPDPALAQVDEWSVLNG